LLQGSLAVAGLALLRVPGLDDVPTWPTSQRQTHPEVLGNQLQWESQLVTP
jgi:hypothetical protein